MGTKEIFMGLVGVIIVGVMTMIGFNVFTITSFNNNKAALAAEMNVYTKQLEAYWGNSCDMGGAGWTDANITLAKVTTYLAFTGANNSYKSANGEFRVISVAAQSPGVLLTLKALGTVKKSNKYPLITTTVKFNQASTAQPVVTTTQGTATSF
jgi:hypothetical protein